MTVGTSSCFNILSIDDKFNHLKQLFLENIFIGPGTGFIGFLVDEHLFYL